MNDVAAPIREIHVAVAVVIRNGRVLIARRPDHAHQGGLLEFPGGKVESGEPLELALKRELQEEVGITPLSCQHFETLEHDYGDKQVRLHFYKVDDFSGTASGVEGQEVAWVSLAKLANFQFPQANKPIVERLLADI
mgnify:CR=1 FL=1